ncbi:D-threonate kinase [subsurface metagenome]
MLRNILKKFNFSDKDIFYKKVDSTLRGCIGAELEGMMNILEKDICIFTPTFPSHQRITIGGYLIVNGKPLGLSKYYSGDLNAGEASFIPFLLKQQTSLSIARIDFIDVTKGQEVIFKKLNKLYQEGNKIIIVDATEEVHLKDILNSILKFEGSVLYAGSAGLANHFPEICNKNRSFKLNMEKNKGPILIVSGSRSPITKSQITHLKEELKLFDLNIDIEKIWSNRKTILEHYLTDSITVIKNGQGLVIHTDPIYNDKENINNKLMQKYNLSFRELELTVREFLGELTAKIVRNSPTRNLILTGGDIALGVCSALGIQNLNIVDELLPGIPLSTANLKNFSLKIVTKAGGFGEKDTLFKLIKKLTVEERV